jgi:hypothetical protein
MKLRSLFGLMSGFLLPIPAIAPFAPTLAQGSVLVPGHKATEARNPISQVLFKPSGGGKPPTTRGAGSRNDRLCPQDAARNPDHLAARPQPLMALVPPEQFGLTWAEHPTVWVYLPKTSARQMALSVRAERQPFAQRFLPITGEPGIVGISLPENLPPLEVGKSYQWAVVLVCGDRPSPNDPFVTAWVQRVLPTQETRSRDLLKQAQIFGQQGIWYDALTTLAAVVRSQSNNSALTEIWTDFLGQPSVGLEAIAKEPLR